MNAYTFSEVGQRSEHLDVLVERAAHDETFRQTTFADSISIKGELSRDELTLFDNSADIGWCVVDKVPDDEEIVINPL